MKTELLRKVFHLLCLTYLAGYHWIGLNPTLLILGAFILLEACVEAARLKLPRFNEALISFFGGIHREEERHAVSGILWTATGCWLTLFFFGSRPVIVDAGILCLAFGDLAAALVGKGIGRVHIGMFGRRKTLEGSLACFAVCAAVALWLGFGLPAALLAAAVATAIELFPVPLNDNLWLPLGAALVLSFW